MGHRSRRAEPEPDRELTPRQRAALRAKLLAWYRAHRRDLPWRRTRDPVRDLDLGGDAPADARRDGDPVLAALPRALPDVGSLATADADDVIELWAGLGYYSRARKLQRAARCRDGAARRPAARRRRRAARAARRRALHAGALASIAFDRPAPIVDGNVRACSRACFAIDDDVRSRAVQDRLWSEAEQLARGEDPGALNQALMELGAIVCTPRAPRCASCPWTRTAPRARRARGALPVRSRPAPVRADRGGRGLLERHDRVLAVQRPQRGLLGGLWELPGGELATASRPRARSRARCARDSGSRSRGGAARRRSSTHSRIGCCGCTSFAPRADVGRVRRTGWTAHRWVSRSALAVLPLGGPTRKAIALRDA
jgi:A/G-specific adenine glycosylase